MPFASVWFNKSKMIVLSLYREQRRLDAMLLQYARLENDDYGYDCGYEYPLCGYIKDERSRQIIQMYIEGYNSKEIGQKFNLGHSQVRKLRGRAIVKLRNLLR